MKIFKDVHKSSIYMYSGDLVIEEFVQIFKVVRKNSRLERGGGSPHAG